MYETYWELKKRPFDNVCGAAAYYPGETHQAAMLQMRYGLENERQAVLLAGESGMGKSLLARLLFENFGPAPHPVVWIKHSQLPAEQMAYALARDLATSDDDNSSLSADSMESCLRSIEFRLRRNETRDQRPVIVVEDAHLVRSESTWQFLRSLLNLNEWNAPLALLLLGQTELLPTLARRRDFEQRLDVKCLLRPFSLDDTMSYVAHRIRAAGGESTIFDDHALERLHILSGGVPRRINRLADLALVVGFADELDVLGAEQIETVSRHLLAPPAA